jgi:preprotein translocase subunit SecE
MGESVETKKVSKIKNWYNGLKAEFKKIIWPDKESIAKQTAAVVLISIVLGAIIKVLDMVVQLGIDKLMN